MTNQSTLLIMATNAGFVLDGIELLVDNYTELINKYGPDLQVVTGDMSFQQAFKLHELPQSAKNGDDYMDDMKYFIKGQGGSSLTTVLQEVFDQQIYNEYNNLIIFSSLANADSPMVRSHSFHAQLSLKKITVVSSDEWIDISRLVINSFGKGLNCKLLTPFQFKIWLITNE